VFGEVLAQQVGDGGGESDLAAGGLGLGFGEGEAALEGVATAQGGRQWWPETVAAVVRSVKLDREAAA
jgi:hypothetical protein